MRNFLFFMLVGLVAYQSADVLSDIGLTQPEGREKVLNGITSGFISVPVACRKMAVAQRANVVSGTVQFAKAYIQTDDFKKRYADWRTNAKPTSSAKSYDQVQQEQKGQIAEMKKSLVQTKASMAKMDAATQKALQEVVKQQEKMVAEMEAGTSPLLMKRETVEKMGQYAEAEYQEKLKKWEADYPENPSVMLSKRLNDFLAVSATVDFGAKLAERNGKKYFINPAYESKSTEWKQCFRAGSEATATARQLAQAWLVEINKN